jgi:hypothetical protein
MKWEVSTNKKHKQVKYISYSYEKILLVLSLLVYVIYGARGSVVVKGLGYKAEGREFETWWNEWISSIYLILPVALGLGVHSASNRNEYQKQKNNVSGE